MAFNLKAQATIEFLLVMMIMLIYLQAFILPSQNFSLTAIHDTRKVILADNASKKIHTAVMMVSFFDGDSSRKLTVFLDKDVSIKCNSNGISFEVELKNVAPILECTNDIPLPTNKNICRKNVVWLKPAGITVNCGGALRMLMLDGIKRKINLTISKIGDTVFVNEV